MDKNRKGFRGYRMIFCKYCRKLHPLGTFFNKEGKCSIQIYKEHQYSLIKDKTKTKKKGLDKWLI